MKTIDAVRYILKHYPFKDELAKGRLNKLVYLSDWKSSMEYGEQITDIEWLFNHYGPYVDDIETLIGSDDRISINVKKNYYGNDKHVVHLDQDVDFNEPSEEEKKVLDFVIKKTKSLNWNQFINAVYSTYPIKQSDRGTILNLVKLAEEYTKLK